MLVAISDGMAAADLPGNTDFDEVHVGVTDDLQFQLAAVEFERQITDEFAFV